MALTAKIISDVDKNEVDSEQRMRKKEKEVGLPPYDVYSVTIEILLSLT
jgi:hypothetical protein